MNELNNDIKPQTPQLKKIEFLQKIEDQIPTDQKQNK